MSLLKWMGMGQSSLKGSGDSWPDGAERYFGLENFGNTCYCNSILQALYFCKPFRDFVLNYPDAQPPTLPSLRHSKSFSGSGTGLLGQPSSIIGGSIGSAGAAGMEKSGGGKKEGKTSETVGAKNPEVLVTATPPSNGVSNNGGALTGANEKELDDSLFKALRELFWLIRLQKKKTGSVGPSAFIQKLRKENELFRGTMHQDAQEFLNYLLNTVAEDVIKHEKKLLKLKQLRSAASVTTTTTTTTTAAAAATNVAIVEDSSATVATPATANILPITTNTATTTEPKAMDTTWLHEVFQGTLTSETKCLTCETMTNTDEMFLDLSLDIEQHTSLNYCLRQFSASEMMCQREKYYCDKCCSLQEAERRMKIKKLPHVLALHLKRFKFQERTQRYVKLSYRVVFPLELRLFDTCEETIDADRLYSLFAIVVHIGNSMNHGHYISIVKSAGQWMLFDDDSVEMIDQSELCNYFGDQPQMGSCYVLFYQACAEDQLRGVL